MKINYQLDPSWRDAFQRLSLLKRKYEYADELTMFVIMPEIEMAKAELAAAKTVPEENFQRLLAVSRKLKVPRIFLGTREIVGADSIRHENCGPAVWEIVEQLDRKGGWLGDSLGIKSCGNTDQSQLHYTELFFAPAKLDKAYDTATGEEISIEPFRKRFVCTTGRNR